MTTGQGRGFFDLWRDRARKHGLYDTPAYWDMKADSYQGLARSNWPSNTYNRHVDARQMHLLDRVLGDIRGLCIADAGCGTGRISLHLAERGAEVMGLDFSPKAVSVAEAEAARRGIEVGFRVHDLLAAPAADLTGRFDVVLTLGCLAIACPDAGTFEHALGHLTAMVKPGGRILFLEPMHASRLLRRILKMSIGEWTLRCERRGLVLLDRGGVCFAPARFVLAFRDIPEPVTGLLFGAGERILDASARFEPLADYKYLLFRRADPAEPAGGAR